MAIGSKMEEVKFKPFRETYRMITFALCVGMIYPNPKTDLWRLAALPIILITAFPIAAMIIIDMYYSLLDRDIVNIIRHSTVVGPFLAGFFKMILMFHKRVSGKQILDEIDRDYERFNHLPSDYQRLTATSVRQSQVYCERSWVSLVSFYSSSALYASTAVIQFIIVTTCVMTFPAMAVVLNLYNSLFKSEPTLYMIHDLNIPFRAKEARFESPYFEIVFAYSFYCSILYVINFIGYDGFFALAINHACLKIDVYCKALEYALAGPAKDMHRGIVAVIKEQNKMFEFVDCIQDTFNIWLGLILVATMIQICTCLYHITEGYGFDLRYMIFVSGAVIHIYLPCRYAAKLKALSAEAGTKIYCSGWENVRSKSVRKMIQFMIARGQKPIEITAFNIKAFDMELFVSIMQTSYSMFTLLRS